MSVHALLDLLLPTPCGGCGADGVAWCRSCAALLDGLRRVGGLDGYDGCDRQADVDTGRTGAGQGQGTPVYALGRYTGPLRTALLRFKERGRRDLAAPFGAALAAAAVRLGATTGPGCCWLVPAPSRRLASLGRGGAPVTALARAAAAELTAAGVPSRVAPGLRMGLGARDSVGLDRQARVANLAGRVRPVPSVLPPPGTSVLLVDDIVTTGTTLEAASRALHGVGVPVRLALVLAAAVPRGCGDRR